MIIPQTIASELGVALNEATLIAIEYDPQRNAVLVTLDCLTLPEKGPEPADRRRLVSFYDVGRIAASLRVGSWNNPCLVVEKFDAKALATIVQSFAGLAISGWQFFNIYAGTEPEFSNRSSLDFRPQSGSLRNSFSISVDGAERQLEVCVWFESVQIFDSGKKEISIGILLS